MVPVKCNVHAWMNAYVGVLEHPFFAVTDANGRFSIPQLPPGTYTIETWHERLGTQTAAGHRRGEGHEGPDVHRYDGVADVKPRQRGGLSTQSARAGRLAVTGAADFVALTKPRLNLLVLVTTVAAYYPGRRARAAVGRLLHTIVGTALVAGGASALNQVWERDTDRLMRRTRRRPLPDARLHPQDALWFGVALVGRRHRRAGAAASTS